MVNRSGRSCTLILGKQPISVTDPIEKNLQHGISMASSGLGNKREGIPNSAPNCRLKGSPISISLVHYILAIFSTWEGHDWVSNPVPKGCSPPNRFSKQGAHGSVPGASQRSSRFRLGYRKRTLFRRTCAQLLIKLFQFRFGCMVVAHDTFPANRFPTAAFSRRRSAAFCR